MLGALHDQLEIRQKSETIKPFCSAFHWEEKGKSFHIGENAEYRSEIKVIVDEILFQIDKVKYCKLLMSESDDT